MSSGIKVAAATVLTVVVLTMIGGVVGATHAASSGHVPSVTGKVIAVNGDVTIGTCGTAGVSGNFIVNSRPAKPISPP